MLRGFVLACIVAVCELVGPQLAAAQAQSMRPNPPPGSAVSAPAKRPVLLVMESAGGVRAASSLRAALNNQRAFSVVSQHEVAQKQLQPSAVLTVAAIGERSVSVAYWDSVGTRDVLSAPAPARADQLDAVVLALSSALLDKHSADWSMQLSIRPSDELYAVLNRVGRQLPRTNIALRFEDF